MPDDLPHIPRKKRPRNKPRDVAWLQQRLSAYRPIYTFRCALPWILFYSLICIGISISLYVNSLKAFEYVLDYTKCHESSSAEVEHFIENGHLYCRYHLVLPEVNGQVMFYYGLRNFYQNIRKYEQSRSDKQLAGDVKTTMIDDCYPYDTDIQGNTVLPCGAIANSMFNDTFKLTYAIPGKYKTSTVPMTSNGLLHPSFRLIKYRNPKKCSDEDEVCPGFNGTIKPPWWPHRIERLGDRDTGRALENFDFIQWMETAALPNFRKLYRKLDQLPGSVFSNGLPAGNYTLLVEYNYNVSEYSGKKLFIVEADGPIGPRSIFQAYAFFGLGLFLFIFSGFMAFLEFSPYVADTIRTILERFEPPDMNGL